MTPPGSRGQTQRIRATVRRNDGSRGRGVRACDAPTGLAEGRAVRASARHAAPTCWRLLSPVSSWTSRSSHRSRSSWASNQSASLSSCTTCSTCEGERRQAGTAHVGDKHSWPAPRVKGGSTPVTFASSPLACKLRWAGPSAERESQVFSTQGASLRRWCPAWCPAGHSPGHARCDESKLGIWREEEGGGGGGRTPYPRC